MAARGAGADLLGATGAHHCRLCRRRLERTSLLVIWVIGFEVLGYRLSEEATMLTGNIRSFVDSSTAISRNYGSELLSGIGRSLITLSFYLRNAGQPWWELGDHLLADIGKTPGDAEVERLRHRPLILDPR
jgi:hypothetical protein